MKKLLLIALLSTLTACGSEDIFDNEEEQNNEKNVLSSVMFSYQKSDVNSPLYYFDGTYFENDEEYIHDDIVWHWVISLDGVGQIATLHPEEDPQYQFLEANTYRVKSIVSNNSGNELDSHYQDITITTEQVKAPVISPTAIIEVTSINGLTAVLDGQSSTHSKGEISEFEWIIEGNTYSAPVRSHHFTQSGQYSVALKVISIDGTQDSTTITLNLSAETTEPVADFTYTADNLSVNFDASNSTNISSNIDSYNWYFSHDNSTANGINITKEFPVEDDYSISLTAISAEGIETEIIKSIPVHENAVYVTCDVLTSSHSIYRKRDVRQCFTSIANGPLTTISRAKTWCDAQITKYKKQMSRIFSTQLTYEVRQQGNNECAEENEL